ncbi:MAG TPA: cyanophycin synthetase [Solirubrobacterales bacterium]|nr:cyanophycin synthetase [Solirubrobacterales bacterium]
MSGTFDPEEYLNSLEAIGWKLGLDRMNLLSDELERPQDCYDTIHVVGTNGKSSVAQMGAALIEAHGWNAGCSLSPHLEHWSERVLVGGEQIAPEAFAAAVKETAAAAERVNAGLGGEEVVTQFEVATAAAFVALADAEVDAAVIEAGLGGRLDATNTIESKVTVLTSIGLDHTEWLGESESEIAAEKLAVLRPGTKLVIGKLPEEVERQAREHAGRLECEVIDAGHRAPIDLDLASLGGFQRDNFTVAMAAVEALIGQLDPDAVREVAGSLIVPGRLEQVGDDPPIYFDVAHNRPGAAALAESIPEIAEGRPVVALIGILADKDALGMLEELAGSINWAVFTELPEETLEHWGRPGARTFPAGDLKRTGDELGLLSEKVADPSEALSRAVLQAEDLGGVVLVCGSHYLLSAVLNT